MGPARDLKFPLGGIDQSTEYELQPEGTTPTARNVVGTDPIDGRERGGTRGGLVKWAADQPNGDADPIQCLDVIVVADTDYRLGSEVNNDGATGEPPGSSTPSTFPDPSTNNDAGGDTDPDNPDVRNPGREIIDGGSGVPPTRREPDGDDGGDGDPTGWRFFQKGEVTMATTAPGVASASDDVALPATELHQMLVVVWATYDDYTNLGSLVHYPATIGVTDDLGNTYTLAGERSMDLLPGAPRVRVGMHWCRNEAGGDATITVTQTSTSPEPSTRRAWGGRAVALEYRGLETATPFEVAVDNAEQFPTTAGYTMTTGAVPVGGQTRLVLGAFFGIAFAAVTYSPVGYTIRRGGPGAGLQPVILEKLSSGTSEEASCVLTLAGPGQSYYAGVGASWRYR